MPSWALQAPASSGRLLPPPQSLSPPHRLAPRAWSGRLDGLLDLLVGHRLDAPAVLDLRLARHQQRADLHVRRRLLLTHLFNRGGPVLFEVGSEREQKIFVERSTRSLQGATR